MNNASPASVAEDQIRELLEQWARATRNGQQDEVLAHHAPDVLIYDVLPPMKYEGAAAYRRSWGDWQPDTQGEGQFELRDLSIVSGSDVAFAHCFIQCGGTLPNGKSFEDFVRATFVSRRSAEVGKWCINIFQSHFDRAAEIEHHASYYDFAPV
ncbi:MAG TPA: nuclear transport factor 2 family protein [Acidobacteriaceae bacterium]|jgi:ketosteroid isomerase-like protein